MLRLTDPFVELKPLMGALEKLVEKGVPDAVPSVLKRGGIRYVIFGL